MRGQGRTTSRAWSAGLVLSARRSESVQYRRLRRIAGAERQVKTGEKQVSVSDGAASSGRRGFQGRRCRRSTSLSRSSLESQSAIGAAARSPFRAKRIIWRDHHPVTVDPFPRTQTHTHTLGGSHARTYRRDLLLTSRVSAPSCDGPNHQTSPHQCRCRRWANSDFDELQQLH